VGVGGQHHAMPRPSQFTHGKNPVHLVQEAWCVTGPVLTDAGNENNIWYVETKCQLDATEVLL